MPVYDLFSKRQAKLRGEVPEVYQHVELSKEFRVQFVHIMQDMYGKEIDYSPEYPENIYKAIHDVLAREYGVFVIIEGYYNSWEERLADFIIKEENIDRVLDAIAMLTKYADQVISKPPYQNSRKYQIPITGEEAVFELNARFKQNGIGYSYEGGEIIRVDSSFVHAEITKPTIALLWNSEFIGANEEYMKAHEHYRHGRNKECLNESLKALESTMKIIATAKGWDLNPKASSSQLVKLLFDNEFVPPYMQTQLTSLRSLLESGTATIRNRVGGHGQGAEPKKADDHLTRYALNLAGSTIVFLVEQSGL